MKTGIQYFIPGSRPAPGRRLDAGLRQIKQGAGVAEGKIATPIHRGQASR